MGLAPPPVGVEPKGPDQTSADRFETGKYWRERSDLIYYDYLDYFIRTIGVDAKSMIDVGSGNCPYLEWFDWIPDRLSVDINTPYESDRVKGIKGDIFKLDFGRTFDICTCLQVLEHIPDARRFARRLLELSPLVLVSVPYKWSKPPVKDHVHDPVSYFKLTRWMGRRANYHMVVQEPFNHNHGARLLALYAADPKVRFGTHLLKKRIIRPAIMDRPS